MTHLVPQSEQELADILKSVDGSLRIMGGGTRSVGHVAAGQVVSTSALSGITLYEPGALTLIAKAGTPVEEIDAALAKENQMLAFESMDHRRMMGTTGTPTIGGVVAGNVSGPRRVSSVGACRDSLLGVRFVDGSGRVLSNGGRVMKNVTGYDLVKLMAGSHGTLGVLTEVSLKVLPRPDTVATITFADIDPTQAVPLMSKALGAPFEVTGVAFGPYHHKEPRKLHVRVEGNLASVKYRAKALTDLLGGFGSGQIDFDPERSYTLWRDIRDMAHLAGLPFVARSSIRPSAATGFVQSMAQVWAGTHYFDWGGGLIWTAANDDDLVRNAQGNNDADAEHLLDVGAKNLIGALHQSMANEDGHTTLIKAGEQVKASVPSFQPRSPAVAALEKGLRAKFDPRNILNPGLME